MRSSRSGFGPVPVVLLLTVLAAGTVAAAATPAVELRSGVVRPGRALDEETHGPQVGTQRWVVRLRNAPGSADRGALEAAGAKVEAPLPGQAYLVSVPADRATALRSLSRVDWIAPFLPQDKISPEIAAISDAKDDADDVVVVVHLFPDADPRAISTELSAAGLRVSAARGGFRFGRVVMLMTPGEVAAVRDDLARRNDVFWIGVRYPRTLANDNTIWVAQSGLDGGQTTPIFDQGLYGEGQIAAVLDTGLDADMCYFRDDALGLPPTNMGTGGTTVDLNQRKVIAVDFLDPAEDPNDPSHWDTQGHGTHVTGILAGDDLANPLLHDQGDGMAPGAKLVIQDAGYAADSCGDLPGIGCPVTDLHPIFQQAYDQGARFHSNSWNDNENADLQNNYSDASQDVDEFMWNNPDFLITVAVGNHPLGGNATMGSPSTAKNNLTTGGTYQSEFAYYLSDISAWGPTDDGRIKPDVVFPGASIQSALNDGDLTTENCSTGGSTGTSMTAPGVTGMAALTREYFQKGYYPTGSAVPANAFDPTAALLKAMIINSAVPIEFDAEGRPITIPSNEQGWGRVLLNDALHFTGENRGLWVDDHSAGFTGPGDAPVIYMLEVHDASEPLKVTLAWTDFPSTPAAATHLVNDIDLRVDGPAGGWRGNNFFANVSVDQGTDDRLNNVEQVLVGAPAPGVYSVRISPHAIPSGPQPWSLVITGNFTLTAGPRPGYFSHVIDDSGPNGNGDGLLDPGETAVVPVTLFNAGDANAEQVIAKMHSAYPGLIKVYGDPIAYGNIAPGQEKSAAGPHYEVTVEPSATCDQILGVNLDLSGNGFDVASGFTLPAGVDYLNLTSEDTPKQIPANSTAGVYSFVNVADDFPYKEVDVTVNIDHQDISEFRVLLLSPPNTGLNLHRNTGEGVSGLHTTYDDLTPPHGPGEMDDFLDLGPAGSWRIRVIDNVAGVPAGTVENWTMHFKNDAPFACNPVSCGEPVPPPVGDTLTVSLEGDHDVRIDWDGVGGASAYHVWRAADAQLLTNELAGAPGGATTFVDSGAQDLPGVHYYVVRSVNECRWESP
jgi:subtilisin-like proprotein convertase family protein